MINQVNCKNCAAPLNLSLNKCEYCLTPLNVSDLTIHSLTKKDYKIHSALEVLKNSQNACVPQTVLEKLHNAIINASFIVKP